MALTLNVPPPLERQLTESKWDAAEASLQMKPDATQEDALLTPKHVYSVVRTPEGTFARVRTKSREDTNVDVDALARARGVHCVLASSGTDAPSGM
jgi:hypothetical protein